jgi:hypothetical protein
VHQHETDTGTMTTGEETKGSDKYKAGNQEGDGVQVSGTLVTGVHPNEQPCDLEDGDGAHVTITFLKRTAFFVCLFLSIRKLLYI